MSKGLRSYPKEDRRYIAHKRMSQTEKGLGYWAAYDWLEPERKAKEALKKMALRAHLIRELVAKAKERILR